MTLTLLFRAVTDSEDVDDPNGNTLRFTAPIRADESSASRTRWSIAPYFFVEDVVATANYYRDKLGFRYERFWGNPPSFCMVWRSGVIIILARHEHADVRPNHTADPDTEPGMRISGSTTPMHFMQSSRLKA